MTNDLPESDSPRPGTSLPREAWIFLPLAVLLLVAISLFTFFSYRNAIELLSEERRSEAVARATRLAVDPDLRPSDLRDRAAGEVLRLLVLNGDGSIRFQVGEPLTEPPLEPLGGTVPDTPTTQMVETGPGSVVAFAPLPAADAGVLRLDLRTPVLAGQRRALRILGVVVFVVNGGLALWLLLFLRRILSPYDALLARVRAHGDPREDEAAFLLRTVERALSSDPAPRRRETELEILERTLGSSLEEGLLLTDREGSVLVVNPEARAILGLENPTRRVPVDEFLRDHPDLSETIRRAVEEDSRVPPTEIRFRDSGDDETRIAVNVTPLRRRDGNAMGFLVLLSDVTTDSRRADEERLARSLAGLGEMAAGVAHELRNGLATLRGYLQLLERSPELDQRSEYLRELDRETRHLERVVKDFLSFARPGTRRLEPVEIGPLLRHLADRPEGGPTSLEIGDGVSSLRISGDTTLLRRAFDNLLRNA
ncbi:MAG: histidine kinase dimerization/phospho-acceptor domain-containing protein, partial [Thermoanaerobaculia bacterium]|nr:histidine kinase dimerization/phospho-acceptor domain-containing protein [Thermoanaerobaculia bacterium]